MIEELADALEWTVVVCPRRVRVDSGSSRLWREPMPFVPSRPGARL